MKTGKRPVKEHEVGHKLSGSLKWDNSNHTGTIEVTIASE